MDHSHMLTQYWEGKAARPGTVPEDNYDLTWSASGRASKACRRSVRPSLRQADPQRAYPHERRRGSMKKLALSGLVLAAAMAVGTAQAEPLTLSADQMDGVTAAGVGFVKFDAFVKNV